MHNLTQDLAATIGIVAVALVVAVAIGVAVLCGATWYAHLDVDPGPFAFEPATSSPTHPCATGCERDGAPSCCSRCTDIDRCCCRHVDKCLCNPARGGR